MNLADEGFLVDPESEWGKTYNPFVMAYETVSKIPCLILIGEPGTGKSFAIKQIYDEANGNKMYVDLKTCGTDERVYRKIFEREQFQVWKDGDGTLNLFLDSLDECLLRIENVVYMLADEFQELPLERLYVRIGCRTANWTNEYESAFSKVWLKHPPRVLELAPLRRVDVEIAARQRHIDWEKFVGEIIGRGVVSFAIKPTTLLGLMDTFLRDGQLPDSQSDLYLEYCERLCQAIDRDINGKHTQLTSAQRLDIASRIAALSVFSNRSAIWIGLYSNDKSESDISLPEISHGNDPDLPNEFAIEEYHLREVLSCGLFSSRGKDRIGWAHQTYNEFLAARCLIRYKVPLDKIIRLLVDSRNGTGRIIPQLQEVSAWLASMDEEVRNEILIRDPQVLLRSDMVNFSSKDTEDLVSGLLEQYRNNQVGSDQFELARMFYKLNHPNLPNQLRPLLEDQTNDTLVRHCAVRIARACKLNKLQHLLVKIALDPSEDNQMRVIAGYAIRDFGDAEAQAQLIEWTKLIPEEDPNDEFKGIALQTLYPDHISGDKMFEMIIPPKKEMFIGAYHYFLSDVLPATLRESDLPVALKWCCTHTMGDLITPIEQLVQQILILGWRYFFNPEVNPVFVNAIAYQMSDYQSIEFLLKPERDKAKVRHLFSELVNRYSPDENSIFHILHLGLISNEDFQWILEQCDLEEESNRRRSWAMVVKYIVNLSDSTQLSLLFESIQRNSDVAAFCTPFFNPIALNSPEAEHMRQLSRRVDSMSKVKQPIFVTTRASIVQYLDAFESGDWNAWAQLNGYMSKTADDRRIYVHRHVTDLSDFDSWQMIDDNLLSLFLSAATRYLIEADPLSDKWLGRRAVYECDAAMAGYRAFRLLLNLQSDDLQKMTAQVWSKWTCVLVSASVYAGNQDEKLRKLLEYAYAQCPDELIRVLVQEIRRENEREQPVLFLERFSTLWDEKLGQGILPLVSDPSIKVSVATSLLGTLLEYGTPDAVELAKRLVTDRYSSLYGPTLAFMSLGYYLSFSEVGWELLLHEAQNDLQFAMTSFLWFAENQSWRKIPVLNPKLQADIYIWLVREFPYEEDPNVDGVHSVSPREQVASLRDGLLRGLVLRGTPDSYFELVRISELFPGYRWLRNQAQDAQINVLGSVWKPITPDVLIRLLSVPTSRLVLSGGHLIDVLIESLERLVQKLHGETPRVVWLWDEIEKGKYKPVYENDFSNFVKQHLEDDLKGRGIVVNREVEISTKMGSNPGERTDIHVNAAVKGGYGGEFDTITVVIETKGNWHQELFTAMQTQLVERYLNGTTFRHGIYLVGWFASPDWITEDNRKPPKNVSIEQLKDVLNKQAETLTKNGICVVAFVMDVRLKR